MAAAGFLSRYLNDPLPFFSLPNLILTLTCNVSFCHSTIRPCVWSHRQQHRPRLEQPVQEPTLPPKTRLSNHRARHPGHHERQRACQLRGARQTSARQVAQVPHALQDGRPSRDVAENKAIRHPSRHSLGTESAREGGRGRGGGRTDPPSTARTDTLLRTGRAIR